MRARRNSNKRSKPGKSVLLTIAILLLGSAVLRAGIGAGQAFAKSDLPETRSEPERDSRETAADLENLINALQIREQRIQAQEEQIRARLQALVVADREIEEKLKRLVEAEERLRSTLALADGAAEGDIDRLVSVYEAMKPKEAAILFEEMSPDFAAGFLGRMRPEAAAGILAGLTPQAAYSLSVILAGRNAAAPRD